MDDLGAYRSHGDLTTQHSICGYLDVLGFTAAVREAEKLGQSDELLRRFAFIVRNWFTSLGDLLAIESGDQRRREYRIFTDNVVVGVPVQHGTRTELAFTVSDLALLQVGLIAEKFFIRGGLTVGELYIDDEIVYGTALLDAHDAEHAACVPRVVLHASAVAAVRAELVYHFSTYGERQGHRFTNALLIDEDGVWFINYLHQVFAAGVFDEPDYHTLETHRDEVQKCLNKYQADPHIRGKYEWALRYHNYFCSTLAGGEDYKISSDLPVLAATEIETVIESE